MPAFVFLLVCCFVGSPFIWLASSATGLRVWFLSKHMYAAFDWLCAARPVRLDVPAVAVTGISEPHLHRFSGPTCPFRRFDFLLHITLY